MKENSQEKLENVLRNLRILQKTSEILRKLQKSPKKFVKPSEKLFKLPKKNKNPGSKIFQPLKIKNNKKKTN